MKSLKLRPKGDWFNDIIAHSRTLEPQAQNDHQVFMAGAYTNGIALLHNDSRKKVKGLRRCKYDILCFDDPWGNFVTLRNVSIIGMYCVPLHLP